MTTDRRRWLSWRRVACCAGVVFVLWWAAGLLGAHLVTEARPFAIPERTELGGRPVAASGFRRIAVHGQSLGAAAAVYTAVRCAPPPAWHFVVLESCYRDIDAALAARLPWLPRPLSWPLVACSEWLLGVDAHDLAPARAIALLRAPTLCSCGTLDNKVGVDATTVLLAASGAAVKERVDVPGIGHGDLWRAGDGVLPRRLAAFVAAR